MSQVELVKCVVDGKEADRMVSHYERTSHGLVMPVPVTDSNEEVQWMLGDARPHIFTVKAQS